MKAAIVSLLLLFPNNTHALNVTIVNPSSIGNSFWDRVINISRAAASDLDITLDVVYANDNRRAQYEVIKEICLKKNKPDFLIISPWFGNAKKTFEFINQAKIPFITLERTLRVPERAIVGNPQENYPYWLGEIYHDNIYAGELLAHSLIKKQIKKFPLSKKINVIAIGGSPNGESRNRIQGLKNAVEQYKKVNLIHVIDANWVKAESHNAVKKLLTRYNSFDIIWTASDSMALGAIEAVLDKATTLQIENTTIGGIDWTIDAISSIKSGTLDASVGGHILQGAWALVEIFNHHNEIRAFIGGDRPAPYRLELITSENIGKFSVISNSPDWEKVDFYSFTQKEMGKSSAQLFNIKAVIEQLSPDKTR